MHTESVESTKIFVGKVIVPKETYCPTEAEIVGFAKQWDPFPWHTDKAAAEKSVFGGLTAPGVMIDAILIRLIHLTDPPPPGAFIGMIGAEDVRYLQPIRPDDQLSGRGEVVSLRRSESNPKRTVAKVRWEIKRADGALVYSRTNVVLCGSVHCTIAEEP